MPRGKTVSTERRSKLEFYYISNHLKGKESPDGLIFSVAILISTFF